MRFWWIPMTHYTSNNHNDDLTECYSYEINRYMTYDYDYSGITINNNNNIIIMPHQHHHHHQQHQHQHQHHNNNHLLTHSINQPINQSINHSNQVKSNQINQLISHQQLQQQHHHQQQHASSYFLVYDLLVSFLSGQGCGGQGQGCRDSEFFLGHIAEGRPLLPRQNVWEINLGMCQDLWNYHKWSIFTGIKHPKTNYFRVGCQGFD